MNTVVYQEPYKLPAGILALLVHAAFFAFLYFGLSWQTRPQSPSAMSVELWQSLPDSKPAYTPPPPKAVVEPPPVQQEAVIKPDIAIPEKKPKIKPEVKPPKKPEAKPEVKSKAKPEVQSKVKPAVKSQNRVVQSAQPSAVEQQAARKQAEQEAATGRVVDDFTGRIQSKIRRNIVMPPNVAPEARAEFMVTLLPDGSVLNATLVRSSGNASYDNAVERSILKSQPLPLPTEAGMFSRFRELKLVFKPVE